MHAVHHDLLGVQIALSPRLYLYNYGLGIRCKCAIRRYFILILFLCHHSSSNSTIYMSIVHYVQCTRYARNVPLITCVRKKIDWNAGSPWAFLARCSNMLILLASIVIMKPVRATVTLYSESRKGTETQRCKKRWLSYKAH